MNQNEADIMNLNNTHKFEAQTKLHTQQTMQNQQISQGDRSGNSNKCEQASDFDRKMEYH